MEVVICVGVAQQLNRWSMMANEHGRSPAPSASWQWAAFSGELVLSYLCQENTGAFIETNCLRAQLATIDKLIMQMRRGVAMSSTCTSVGDWDTGMRRCEFIGDESQQRAKIIDAKGYFQSNAIKHMQMQPDTPVSQQQVSSSRLIYFFPFPALFMRPDESAMVMKFSFEAGQQVSVFVTDH